MESKQNILAKGILFANEYEIQFPIGSNSFSQSYRAKTKTGSIVRIDLINLAALPSSFFNPSGKLISIALLKSIKHPNISCLLNEGETIIEKQKYAFVVFEFVSGESLIDKLKREPKLSPYEAVPLVIELLEAVSYLHNLPEPIIHNGIAPSSVVIDLSTKKQKPVLIGFEQARSIHNNGQSISTKHLACFYSAPELMNGIFIPQSDIFSAGALLYHLLFGVAPWFNENIINQPINKQKGLLEEARSKKLIFDFADKDQIDDHLINTLKKSLAINVDDRFQSVEDFSKALKREMMMETFEEVATKKPVIEKKERKKGSGFDQIAGMDELKAILYNDVIRALSEKELYATYGVTIPNGMLLFGPPGCGKTFIAQKFAEEVGYNFVMIKPSDLKSKWVNATEENIGKLFKEAEENAPTIIFIDELDAIVPTREGDLQQGAASAVNEVLAQMTNCGERGIFVVGATNRPEKIDPAILRSGRLDKTVYLPPPDFKAREAMFELYLKNRPIDLAVDYEKLAQATENYVSSDIKFLIDEASRKALVSKSRITMGILEEVIRTNKPSVSLKEIKKYELLKRQWDNEKANVEKEKNERKPLGFNIKKDKED